MYRTKLLLIKIKENMKQLMLFLYLFKMLVIISLLLRTCNEHSKNVSMSKENDYIRIIQRKEMLVNGCYFY